MHALPAFGPDSSVIGPAWAPSLESQGSSPLNTHLVWIMLEDRQGTSICRCNRCVCQLAPDIVSRRDPLALSAHVQQASDLSLQVNAPQTHGGSPFPPQQCPAGACIRSLATNAGPLHGSFSLADPNTTFAIVNGIQATCSDGTQLSLQAVLPAAHYTQNWTATYNASQMTAPAGCCFPGAQAVGNACIPSSGQGGCRGGLWPVQACRRLRLRGFKPVLP